MLNSILVPRSSCHHGRHGEYLQFPLRALRQNLSVAGLQTNHQLDDCRRAGASLRRHWLTSCGAGDGRLWGRNAWQSGVVSLVGEVDVAGHEEHRTSGMLSQYLDEASQDAIIVVGPVEPGQGIVEVRFDGQCPQGDLVLADDDAAGKATSAAVLHQLSD